MSLPELTAEIATAHGTIHLRLFADQVPMTVASFANLARRGFYDGKTFHRVIPDFMRRCASRAAARVRSCRRTGSC